MLMTSYCLAYRPKESDKKNGLHFFFLALVSWSILFFTERRRRRGDDMERVVDQCDDSDHLKSVKLRFQGLFEHANHQVIRRPGASIKTKFKKKTLGQHHLSLEFIFAFIIIEFWQALLAAVDLSCTRFIIIIIINGCQSINKTGSYSFNFDVVLATPVDSNQLHAALLFFGALDLMMTPFRLQHLY